MSKKGPGALEPMTVFDVFEKVSIIYYIDIIM